MSVKKLTRALAASLALAPVALLGLCLYYAGGLTWAVAASGAFAFALQASSYFAILRGVVRPVRELAAASVGSGPGRWHRGTLPAEIDSIRSYVLSAGALLEEYREQHRNLLMSIPDMLIELDRDGLVVSANRAALVLTGYEEDGLLGHPLLDVIEPEWKPRWQHTLSMLQEGESAGVVDLKITLASGGASYFELNAAPLWKDGVIAGFCCVGRDIEERRKIITELEAARKHAEEASAKLKKTVSDLEEFSLLAVRRELKMQELREMFVRLKEEHEINKEFPG